MEVTLAGLEETGELAMGLWLNPSQVRNFPLMGTYVLIATTKTETNQWRRWSHGLEN